VKLDLTFLAVMEPIFDFCLSTPVCYVQGGRARHAFAWPGWKQSDISVEMEPARLGNSRFKKGCVKCVLLSYPSTELEATLTV
jgi:hypothetical protein